VWNSRDPREGDLLGILFIIYSGILALLTVTPMYFLISMFIFIFNASHLTSIVEISYFATLIVVIVSYVSRFYLLCEENVMCLLVKRSFYYAMVLQGALTGSFYAFLAALITYYVLTSILGFSLYTSLLAVLTLAITTFTLALVIYFKGPIYVELPIYIPFYIRTGVSNIFQWYLRKRDELLARGVCKLGDVT